jgi:hypothetical protein
MVLTCKRWRMDIESRDNSAGCFPYGGNDLFKQWRRWIKDLPGPGAREAVERAPGGVGITTVRVELISGALRNARTGF